MQSSVLSFGGFKSQWRRIHSPSSECNTRIRLQIAMIACQNSKMTIAGHYRFTIPWPRSTLKSWLNRRNGRPSWSFPTLANSPHRLIESAPNRQSIGQLQQKMTDNRIAFEEQKKEAKLQNLDIKLIPNWIREGKIWKKRWNTYP